MGAAPGPDELPPPVLHVERQDIAGDVDREVVPVQYDVSNPAGYGVNFTSMTSSIGKDPIIHTLKDLGPAVGPSPDLAALNPLCAEYQRIDDYQVGATSELVERLTDVLRDDPILRRFEDTTLQSSPGSEGFYGRDTLRQMAQWLLAQSRKRAPEEVVDQLETFVRTNSVRVRHVVALWGTHPSQQIEVHPGIRLVPLTSLPRSRYKDELTDVSVYRNRLPYERAFTLRPKADAALVQEFVQEPVFSSGPLRTEAERQTVADTLRVVHEQHETMLEIARCLVLAQNSAIYPILHWYHPDDTPLFGGAQSGGATALEHIHGFGVPAEEFDQDSVKSLVSGYFGLDEATRDRLRVPLTRLNSSMMRRRKNEVEDASIDLGIAMEALLTKERDYDAPVSYLLRLRGTVLLGGDSDTRRRNYVRIKELYALRSKAAHGENVTASISVPRGPNRQRRSVDAREFLSEGTKLCADMIKAVIRRGEIPDWEAMVAGL